MKIYTYLHADWLGDTVPEASPAAPQWNYDKDCWDHEYGIHFCPKGRKILKALGVEYPKKAKDLYEYKVVNGKIEFVQEWEWVY